MTPDRVDQLLSKLNQEKRPEAPNPRQILAEVRERIATEPPLFIARLNFAQLSTSLATTAIVLGFLGGIMSLESKSSDTVAGLRNSLRLNVFEADSLGVSYEFLLNE